MALGIDLLTLQTLYTDRGYTGHLHADGVGLIHMNGRMYDPILARFISADPLIQSPNNLQIIKQGMPSHSCVLVVLVLRADKHYFLLF